MTPQGLLLPAAHSISADHAAPRLGQQAWVRDSRVGIGYQEIGVIQAVLSARTTGLLGICCGTHGVLQVLQSFCAQGLAWAGIMLPGMRPAQLSPGNCSGNKFGFGYVACWGWARWRLDQMVWGVCLGSVCYCGVDLFSHCAVLCCTALVRVGMSGASTP